MFAQTVKRTLKRALPTRGFSATSLAQVEQVVPSKTLDEHLHEFNQEVDPLLNEPLQVLKWSMNKFNGNLAMSTSFGIQSAVLLHLATRVKPDIPVIWVDTGYLPKETYEYAELLKETLNLNLKVQTNTEWSPARMEAKFGKLWETDHKLYGKMRKVEPLKKGIESLRRSPKVLLSGLRSSQTKARANMPPVGFQHNRFKLLPMLKMSEEDVANYFDKHDLPRHPLESKGYVTVGDWHSSRPVEEGEDARNTRFGGKFQECGLHVEEESETNSTSSSEVATVENTSSFEKTGVSALRDTEVNAKTGLSVIVVKKIMEDGSFCRKCNDVQNKIETDGIAEYIGDTLYADLRDKTSEGITLAKHFEVETAPFFLVKSKQDEEWKVLKAYLPLKKMIQKSLV